MILSALPGTNRSLNRVEIVLARLWGVNSPSISPTAPVPGLCACQERLSQLPANSRIDGVSDYFGLDKELGNQEANSSIGIHMAPSANDQNSRSVLWIEIGNQKKFQSNCKKD